MIGIESIPEHEIELAAIRAGGPGGQNVNKVSSAIHLRFDVRASSLPDLIKVKLLALNDVRVTADGVVVIKAQTYRSQEKNKAEALMRLDDMLRLVQQVKKPRTATRPTRGSMRRRLDSKRRQGERKKMRGKVGDRD